MKISKFNEAQWAEDNRLGGEGIMPQEVDVYLIVYGDYCAFGEMTFRIAYDITNDIRKEDYTLDQLKYWEGDGSDAKIVKALKVGKKYYVSLTR